MTEQEIRNAYKEWIKDYCNDDFTNDEGIEELPVGVELALEELVEAHLSNPEGVQSKKHRKMSITYFSNKVQQKVLDLLAPYRKLRW